LDGGLNTIVEETTSWVDAVIGFRASVDVSRAVSLSLRGDVGGFSIGNSSTFTWQVLPALEWRFTEHWTFGLGWRTIAIKKGRADDTIIYGLDVGAGYRF